MKPNFSAVPPRGYALVTVVLFSALLLALSAGLLSWSTTEIKVDSSHKRRLSARNTAEAVLEYGLAQAALQVQQITDFDTAMFDPSASTTHLAVPPDAFFAGTNIDPTKLEVVARVIAPLPGRFDIDSRDPRNIYSSLSESGRKGGLEVIARATTRPDVYGHAETYYLKKIVTILDTPVFKYAAFYNMDFEVAPGPDLNIYGPVHTNGDLWLSKQSTGGNLNFWDKVTGYGSLHKGFKVEPIQADGSRETSKNGHINFITPAGAFVDLFGNWGTSTGIWRDEAMGGMADPTKEYVKFTNKTYGDITVTPNTPSFLQTKPHGVARRPLPGQLDNYVPDPDPTDGIIDPTYRNVPRALIERPLNSGDTEYVGIEVEKQKMSRKAGLYIAVNATGGPLALVKDPAGVAIAGGFVANEYRAWMKNPDVPHNWVEVRLPWQPDFGAHAGHNPSAVTPSPLPRPIITVKPNQMVDLRRYNERSATAATDYDFFSPRSATNMYKPKTINIIEVDMTALKKAVERSVNSSATVMIFPYDSATSTSTYRATIGDFGTNGPVKQGLVTLTDDDLIEGMPNSSYWDGSIYIESIDADFLSTGTVTATSPAPTPTGSYPTRRDRGHRKSGVRLINGRGPVASANLTRTNDATHPCSPGITLSTNDAIYILGHLNADGIINPTALPASTPSDTQLGNVNTTDGAGSGNNSSLFPDPPIITAPGAPTESPLALVGDAVTILSQPTYDASGIQIAGWTDTLSFLAFSAGNWSGSWMNSVPGGANKKDGEIVAAPPTPPALPLVPQTASDTPFDPLPPAIASVPSPSFLSVKDTPSSWNLVKTFRSTKFPAAPTEISAGFILGLTPSAKNPTSAANDGQNSGGLHNLPRFLESWKDPATGNSVVCAIRGSMVVMFESQVAWEPWSLRVYEPPARFWGFNNLFRNYVFSDDIPATRNLCITSGDTFQRLDRAGYIAEQTRMWSGYTFPTPP